MQMKWKTKAFIIINGQKEKKNRKYKKNLTYYAELIRDFSLLGENIRNKKNNHDISVDYRNVTIGLHNKYFKQICL